jgi:hypothetical protein
VKGKLRVYGMRLPYTCDVCNRPRSLKVHTRCSKIRQERHAQQLRDEAFDNHLATGGYGGLTVDQVFIDEAT